MARKLDVKIRRGQLITPWGVGSVMPLPNDESCVIGGLSWWNNETGFSISDDRLKSYLNVAELRWPPYCKDDRVGSQSPDSNITIPVFRFPNWYYCPKCGHVEWVDPCNCNTAITCMRCRQKGIDQKMVPERFILVCPNGHMDNIPILEMLFGPTFDTNLWKTDFTFRSSHQVFRDIPKNSASVSAIVYKCPTDKLSISLGQIFGHGNVGKFLKKCPGTMPWLNTTEKCDCPVEDLAVVQSGGSNVWFPDIFSSIYIPNGKAADDCITLIMANKQLIDMVGTDNGGAPVAFLTKFAKSKSCDPKKVIEAWNSVYGVSTPASPISSLSEAQYKYVEYQALSGDSSTTDVNDLCVKSATLADYKHNFASYFSGISLVTKLKETRALYGFSRLKPSITNIEDAKRHLTVDGKTSWLPAVQNYGEGIFFRFNEKLLERWSTNKIVKDRADLMDKHYQASDYPKKSFPHITPQLVLIHTFAHLLMNQLSKHCGYGSSSLRERLYVSEDPDTLMHGVLIYTSSGDSEGSLGGLVKQGKPNRLENTLYVALQEAMWCSSDPVCIESNGQGPDSCNLAACHNCALLPETSCETGNRFLDRGLLIGLLNGNSDKLGFFEDFLK